MTGLGIRKKSRQRAIEEVFKTFGIQRKVRFDRKQQTE